MVLTNYAFTCFYPSFKPFVVVVFLGKNKEMVEVVPKTWIKSIGTNNLAEVYWPPFGDLALQKAQTNSMEPEPGTWEVMMKVRVIAAAGEFLIRPFTKCYDPPPPS